MDDRKFSWRNPRYPWWKWAVIFFPALLMAAMQILHLARAPEVAASAADRVVFAVLAAAILANTLDHVKMLRHLLR